MPFALAAVPILGAAISICCGHGALYLDWCQQRVEHALSVGANIGGPVLVRYASLLDPKVSPTPHRLFATGQGGYRRIDNTHPTDVVFRRTESARLYACLVADGCRRSGGARVSRLSLHPEDRVLRCRFECVFSKRGRETVASARHQAFALPPVK